MRYVCNFSLVSLGTRPRSRRCAERTRQRPPKAALEPSYIRPRIPVPRIACFGRDKKLLTKYTTPKGMILYIYIYIAHPIYCLRTFFLFFFSLPRHNSDPGSVSRLFPPLPTTVRAFVFVARTLSSLVNSHSIAIVLRKVMPQSESIAGTQGGHGNQNKHG